VFIQQLDSNECHSRENGNPLLPYYNWIPAFESIVKQEIASSSAIGGLLAMTKLAFLCHCEAVKDGRGNLEPHIVNFDNKPLRGYDNVIRPV